MGEEKAHDECSDSLPFNKFVVRELRKLLEKLAPLLVSALAGGGTAFVGWQVQGRDQARQDAVQAAQKEILLVEEFKAFLRARTVATPSAPPGIAHPGSSLPIVPMSARLTTPEEIVEQFSIERGLAPEDGQRLTKFARQGGSGE